MNSVKYIHIRPPSKQGRAITVAYEISHIVSGVFDVHFGMAFCSSKDNFCKATGRRIAAGRLHTRKTVKRITNILKPDLDAAKYYVIKNIQFQLYQGACPVEFAQNKIVNPGKDVFYLLKN